MAAIEVLAENNFGDTRSGGLAGPMGLFIIVLLAIVTVLLIRNMSKRIRRLPDRFPGQDEPPGSSPNVTSRSEADVSRGGDVSRLPEGAEGGSGPPVPGGG